MKKIILLFLFGISISNLLFAQNPSTTFATWKNNATGAYSLIHDDFSTWSVQGIQNYADTIAYNRGVKFTFGAITNYVEPQTWPEAVRMINHGHEIINHTANHYCAEATPACANSVWTSFAVELDQSTALIQTKTTVYPRFFIWPYDIFTQASKDYLQGTLHYYGARGGLSGESLNADQLNGPVLTDFMSINFSIYGPNTPANELNDLVDLCIAEGKWGMREVHGVNDASWASVSLVNYRAHMDYIRSKILSNEIWCATASEVTTYKMQSQNFIPTTTYNGTDQEIHINWNDPGIDVSDFRSDVTLNVNLDGLTGFAYIYQDDAQIKIFTTNNGVLTFNAYPHKGEIVIRKTRWMGLPPGPFTVSSTNLCTGQSNVAYEVPDIDGAIFTWTYSGVGATINGNGHHVTVDFSTTATSGTLSVTATTYEGTTEASSVNITLGAGYEVQGDVLCGAGVADLQVLTAGNYEWYTAPTGGTLLSSNAIYQPNVSTTTAYYTQRKTEQVTYSLGKLTQGTVTTMSNNIMFAQRFTIETAMSLTSVKLMAVSSAFYIKVFNGSTGAMVAQSPPWATTTYGEVVTLNFPLPAGPYYIVFYNNSGGPTKYETAIASPFVTAGVGTVENKMYDSFTNNGVLNVFNTTNNVYGPFYDLKFTATLASDPCPRYKVEAVVNTTPDQPTAFVGSVAEACLGSINNFYSVAEDPNISSYTWSYTSTGATINGISSSVMVDFAPDALPGDVEVSATNACGTSASLSTPVIFVAASVEPVSFINSSDLVTQNDAGVLYEIQSYPGETYEWSYSGTGATWAGTGAQILVDFSSSATSGNLTVRSVNTCGFPSNVLSISITVNPLVTSVQSDLSALNTYPNPISEWVNIETPFIVSEGVLSVTDMRGVVVRTAIISGQQYKLHMEGLPAGIYLMSIATNYEVYRTKLVKR